MAKPSAAQLHEFVTTILGNRGGDGSQSATGAMGFIRNQEGIYVALQGKVLPDQTYRNIVAKWSERRWDGNVLDANSVVDARYLTDTRRRMSEWTGYHAEMLVLSAMLCANDVRDRSAKFVDTGLKSLGGAVIVANARACHHCGSLMDLLGIKYHGAKGRRSNTGWWNPLTDNRFAKGSPGFEGRELPS